MKLYATVSSERATEGQGGNKHLTTLYTCKNEETGLYDEVARIEATIVNHNSPSLGGTVTIRFTSLVDETEELIILPKRYQTKGEKTDKCKKCGEIHDVEKAGGHDLLQAERVAICECREHPDDEYCQDILKDKSESEVIDFLEGNQDYKEGEKQKGEGSIYCKARKCPNIASDNPDNKGYCADHF